MRTGKDIDFTHVDFITYALNEYWKDIPILKVVRNYVLLQQIDKEAYFGEFKDDKGTHKVVVFTDVNIVTIDDKPVNPEEFIMIFEGEETDPIPIIYKLTGVDHEDYISDVQYSDGTIELLEVKGKCLLLFGYYNSSQCDDKQ